MLPKDHPCGRGLTPECFELFPEDAKKAFAYRLLHTLFPANITRRLPRVFRPPWYDWGWIWIPWAYLIFEPWYEPGEDDPTGESTADPLPPGVDVDPAIVFPPDWTPGDPLPPGVDVDPGKIFPPDWNPGDLPPPGVVIDPGTIFPPGWKPGDPLPPGTDFDPGKTVPPGGGGGGAGLGGLRALPGEGVPTDWTPEQLPAPEILHPPILPKDEQPGGIEPAAYTRIWEPGPAHRPYGGIVVPSWFREDFADLTTNSWSTYTYDGATAEAVGGILELRGPNASSVARAWMNHVLTHPTNWEVEFYLLFHTTSGSNSVVVEFWTGAYRVKLVWRNDGDLDYYEPAGATRLTGVITEDAFQRWTIRFVDGLYSVARGETDLVSGATPYNGNLTANKIWLEQGRVGWTLIDYISIVEL